MTPKHAIAKNFIYNTLFKVFQLGTPIITVPYVARVLGSDGIGAYAFTGAVIGYFALFGALGVLQYGNRSIAYVRDNIEERSRVFFEIFTFKLIASIIALSAYIIFIFTFGGKYKVLYLIQVFVFLHNIFDINWFFAALEDFKRIIIRDVIVRIISIILIFTLVNTKEDLNIYVFILSFSAFISSLYMCACLRDKIVFVKPDFKKIFSHVKPMLIIFVPVLASQVYAVFDRILLGVYAGESEVGCYEMAQKIIMLASTATMTLGVVMYPRMSNLFAKQDFVVIKGYIGKGFRFLHFLSIPMVLGILAISDDFVPWFLGDDFQKVPLVMNISSVLIFLNAWGSSLNNQVLMPMGREKDVAINAVIGAVISLGLNFSLIPHFQAVGAAFSAIITSFILRISLFYILKDFLPFKEMFKEIWKYLLSGLIMFVIVYYIGILMPASVLTTFIQVLTGSIFYFVISLVLRCEMNKLLIEKSLEVSGLGKKLNLYEIGSKK